MVIRRGDRREAGKHHTAVEDLTTYGAQARAVGKSLRINSVTSENTIDGAYGVMNFYNENDFVFSVSSAPINHHPQLHLLDGPRHMALAEEIIEQKRSGAQPINGTPELVEHFLPFKDFCCHPTAFTRIYNGDGFYPYVPWKNIDGNLLQMPSLKRIYRRARKTYNEILDRRGRCHLYVNVIFRYYVHGFWNLAKEYPRYEA